MSDDVIIRAENIGKCYTLDHQSGAGGYRKFSDTLIHAAKTPLRWLKTKNQEPGTKNTKEDFWALKDVSFEIKRGEVVGIIGRNGAGKSTLLKVLSRITEPTKGRITLDGRVASLLEVGTGFHPELTGRENIFLNGAILGMRKEEIKAKFDEIVAFAEIEKFLDTPVKRYSSGMYVRLAFAVAAHLEPEILIVDEVLAVGDAQFQAKCLGKMQDVARGGGRTVLFVSHNMATLQSLCSRGIILSAGSVQADTNVEDSVKLYLSSNRSKSPSAMQGSYKHRGDLVRVMNVELLVNGQPSESVISGSPCSFRISYETLVEEAIGRELSVSIMIHSESAKLTNLWTNYAAGCGEILAMKGDIFCHIERWPFREFNARAEIYTHIGQRIQDWIDDSLVFDSIDGDYYDSGIITHKGQGSIFINHTWNSKPCQ